MIEKEDRYHLMKKSDKNLIMLGYKLLIECKRSLAYICILPAFEKLEKKELELFK
jgi:hypothetical protein